MQNRQNHPFGNLLRHETLFVDAELERSPGNRMKLSRREGEKMAMLGNSCSQKGVHFGKDAFELYGSALEDMVLPLLVVNSHGNVEWCNSAFRNLSGFGAEDMSGEKFWDLLVADHENERLAENFHQNAGTGQVWMRDLSGRRRDGSSYRAELLFVSTRLKEKQEKHFVLQLQNILESECLKPQKRDDRDLWQQSQQLEVLDRLAGRLAHNLNNSLVPITICPELITKRLGDSDHPALPYLRQIQRAGEQISQQVNDLLCFTRRRNLDTKIIEPQQLLERLRPCLTAALYPAIELQLRSVASLPSIAVDRGCMQQVLLGLCENARDASPDGGTVHITLSEIIEKRADKGLAPGAYVCISVADNGQGIAPEIREHVSQPFFTTKEKGLGLGLSIASEITEQHGGFLTIDSVPEKGTVVNLFLPTVNEGPFSEPAEGEEKDDPIDEPRTVLVVDDEADVRRSICEYLQSAGFQILEADCGDKALEILKDSTFSVDLILTDIAMPGMNGYELVEDIKLMTPAMPVVYMSGHVKPGVPDRPMSPEEKSVHIRKPFHSQDLLKLIESSMVSNQKAQ